MDAYDVYKVPYLTYEEVQHHMVVLNASFEDVMAMRKRVAYGLPFAQAKELVEMLGFGHSMHPTR